MIDWLLKARLDAPIGRYCFRFLHVPDHGHTIVATDGKRLHSATNFLDLEPGCYDADLKRVEGVAFVDTLPIAAVPAHFKQTLFALGPIMPPLVQFGPSAINSPHLLDACGGGGEAIILYNPRHVDRVKVCFAGQARFAVIAPSAPKEDISYDYA